METRKAIAGLLVGSPLDGLVSVPEEFQEIAQFHKWLWEQDALLHLLGESVDRPIPNTFYISPNAPLRGVMDDVERLVQDQKKQENAPQKRRREDSYEGYLRAWDLREGWVGEKYDGQAEKRLKDIALVEGAPWGRSGIGTKPLFTLSQEGSTAPRCGRAYLAN